MSAPYRALRMAGRRPQTGSETDRGWWVHAVPVGEYVALCCAHPRRLSAGWLQTDGEVTCPRCVRRIEKESEDHA